MHRFVAQQSDGSFNPKQSGFTKVTFGGAIVTFPHDKVDVMFEVQMAHVPDIGDEPWSPTIHNR